MSGKYVRCAPKKKFRKMGLHSVQLQKLLINPGRTGRNINVDHRDGIENNYQKDNLRLCTHAENMKNRKPNSKYADQEPTSKFKGVYWFKKYSCWRADIRTEAGKRIYIGMFDSEEAAANAYNYYAKIYHREYARLNDVAYMPQEEWLKYKCKKQTSSQYRGVSFVEGKWLAQICHNRSQIRIGSFDSEVEAAKAYNEKAKELKGNKAKLNDVIGK
jgi:hypothetical protein